MVEEMVLGGESQGRSGSLRTWRRMCGGVGCCAAGWVELERELDKIRVTVDLRSRPAKRRPRMETRREGGTLGRGCGGGGGHSDSQLREVKEEETRPLPGAFCGYISLDRSSS